MSALTTFDSSPTITTDIIPESQIPTYLQAQSISVGGLVVRQDFQPVIDDFRNREDTLWASLAKFRANAAKIQTVRKTGVPTVGFVDRTTLGSPPTSTNNNDDLTDPGQDLKAIVGILDFGHFAASLQVAQGSDGFETLGQITEDLVLSVFRTLGSSLISGNATTNPLHFNGINSLVPGDAQHTRTLNITGANPPKISQELSKIIAIAFGDRTYRHRISHIICSAAGYLAIQKEANALNLYQNQATVIPGVGVPAIGGLGLQSNNPQVIVSSYVFDTLGTGSDPDTLTYYLIDRDSLPWYGLPPLGGSNTFEPQIFDVSTIVNNQPLLQKRMVLLYGTPYARNRGQGLYKLTVTAPGGTGIYAA
jgi:hypothetical protein